MTGAATTARNPALPEDQFAGLRTLIWARLLTAAVALPFGILLRAESPLAAWRLLGIALAVVGGVSALLWLGTVWARARTAQVYVHLGVDVVLVGALASLTGGHQSPFSMFYVLVVITGGLQAGFAGGLIAAAAASASFVALSPGVRGVAGMEGDAALPHPAAFAALLLALGVLASVLQRRAHRATEKLHQAARELDRVRFDNDVILRHLNSGVITLDENGMVAYMNPAAEDVLKTRLADVRGRWVHEALPERLRPLRDTLLTALERHAVRSRGELLLDNENGQPLPLGISTKLLRHEGDVTGVVAVFQDLTEVREMEARALQNKTLAEVGALAAGIAHELRNGLSPISGSVECLQRELKLEGENAQLMELIQTECARLNRFVTDLLAYSRERPLVRESLDLDENLAELCEGLKRDPRRSPGVEIRYAPGRGTVELQADREQLRQVWLNLARNALESMGETGILTVRWLPGGAAQVAVEFEDTGSGISPDDLARVGRPFFTTKKGGTGLGIPIALRIVERHGGTLTLRPASGRGAIARVTLPGTVAALVRAA